MRLVCSDCEKGDHEGCTGLLDSNTKIDIDCECECQVKNQRSNVCPDCGEPLALFRPDCHSLSAEQFETYMKAMGENTKKETETMQEQSLAVVGTGAPSPAFPFKLEDLAYWVVKRKDGTTIKYTLVEPGAVGSGGGKTISYPNSSPSSNGGTQSITTIPRTSMSDWCKHDPIGAPIWDGSKVKIWIADAMGLKNHFEKFDIVFDMGDVLSDLTLNKQKHFMGDEGLIKEFAPFLTIPSPRIIKVDWLDRKAPDLLPEVWKSVAEYLVSLGEVKVVTACQGGHGRSGTSLVCLMMALNPEYTPYSAICHLRAMHCPRAIESKEQHAYINSVGMSLGREGDIAKVSEVTNFKESFLSLKLKSSKKYQERLSPKK